MLHGRYDCRWAARINVRKRVALGRVNVRKRRVCERGSIRAETVTVAKILLPPGGESPREQRESERAERETTETNITKSSKTPPVPPRLKQCDVSAA